MKMIMTRMMTSATMPRKGQTAAMRLRTRSRMRSLAVPRSLVPEQTYSPLSSSMFSCWMTRVVLFSVLLISCLSAVPLAIALRGYKKHWSFKVFWPENLAVKMQLNTFSFIHLDP